MKEITTFVLLLISVVAGAQGRVRLYDEMCDPLQAVFCDYVDRASSQNAISGIAGEYVGTMIDGKIYGWGMLLTDDGACTFGQFRNGKIIFGISMNDEIAKVGSDMDYVVYDLSTGGVIRLHTREGNMRLGYPLVPSDENPHSPYSFRKVTYANGDCYIGEFYNGKRHGYGIYYWSNGEIWYGRYVEGYRNGYGMLVSADRRICYGKWLGDSRMDE